MHGEAAKTCRKRMTRTGGPYSGKNINKVERIAAEKAEVKYAVDPSCCMVAF